MKRAMTIRLAVLAVALCAAAAAGAADPDYPHGEFSADCSQCHGDAGWKPARIAKDFVHSEKFPLAGAHRSADCRACHLSLDFAKAPTACADCHRDPHRGELGVDCARCHSPRNFLDRSAQLDAHRASRFPLVGAHVTADCASCHRPQPQGALTWVGLPVECQGCHLPQYEATTDPNHLQAQFPTDCALCHTPTAWSRALFDHARSGFPLTGAHRTVACQSCHANGYTGTPTQCVACHQADYDGTTDPNHRQLGFSTDCAQCHNTTSFAGATFNHATTGFPLTGAHVVQACTACHTSATPPPTDCYSCHQADYDGTTDPPHQSSGFPHDCAQCHTTTTFTGATFDHTTTGFPLTGAHTTVTCVDCHHGVYQGTSPACDSCHHADYVNAPDPNHQGAGFSTDCTPCHTTTTFAGSRYTQHDGSYFPIYSGTHLGRWSLCADCHNVPSAYSNFSCFLCHSQADTDSHHTGVSGYQYNSQACYSCHPTGRKP